MKTVLVIGSINLDNVLRVQNLPKRGETIIAKNYEIVEGGKGANQAAAIGKLGVKVSMFGKIGNMLGITAGGAQTFGNVAGGLGQLGNMVLGYKQYQASKDLMDFQKDYMRQNYENQAKLMNYKLQEDQFYRSGLNQRKVRTPRVKESL